MLARRFFDLAIAAGLAVIPPGALDTAVDPTLTCPPTVTTCTVTVARPADPAVQAPQGATPASGGSRVCITPGYHQVVDCFSAAFGWFNNLDGCYYRTRDPQPSATDSVWNGHYPSGTVYDVTCADPSAGPGTSGGWTWLASPPDGFGATATTPGEVAARAVDQMALVGPAIGITVTPDKTGLVGVPVWLWTAVSPTTWGPNSATASVPGLSVTATAQATQIAWDMGDGTMKVCKGPGTAYFAGGVHSPTCEHVYVASSAGQPNDAYRVTATATWEVTWTGGGTSGVLTVSRSSSTTVRIGELQVLVTG